MNIEQQVIARAKRLVINQSRYIFPAKAYSNEDCEVMCVVADNVTDLQTLGYLTDKSILSDEKLIALSERIGLEDLYHCDHWVDAVADYIVDNKADCEDLWNYLRSGI